MTISLNKKRKIKFIGEVINHFNCVLSKFVFLFRIFRKRWLKLVLNDLNSRKRLYFNIVFYTTIFFNASEYFNNNNLFCQVSHNQCILIFNTNLKVDNIK